jgi:hypothetical protein
MIDPKQQLSQDEEETAERKPELESERIRDLEPPDEQADAAKGGMHTADYDAAACGCETM